MIGLIFLIAVSIILASMAGFAICLGLVIEDSAIYYRLLALFRNDPIINWLLLVGPQRVSWIVADAVIVIYGLCGIYLL